jgi:Mg-chelatase subunit ChlI
VEAEYPEWVECVPSGIDTTHPPGHDTTHPSVAAVVGSLNPEMSNFGSQILLQGHRVEVVSVSISHNVQSIVPFTKICNLGIMQILQR